MAKGKIYSIRDGKRLLRTTQNNVVIPTEELIKNKKANLKILACISAISNVDDITKSGDNDRYCSIKKLNNNLNSIQELLGISRSTLMKNIRQMAECGSEEFYTMTREYEGEDTSCVVINYKSGGFVNIEYEIMERLISALSNNAFKLYINLLWLCKDKISNRFVERQLTQEYLLKSIGLSTSSKRLLKKAEDELVEAGLIIVKTKWEIELNDDLSNSTPKTKKYYKII